MKLRLLCIHLLLPAVLTAQVTLSNDNATPEARQLYEFLSTFKSNPDQCLILGQNLGWAFEMFDENVAALHEQSGQWPGLIGGQMRVAPGEIDYPALVQLYSSWTDQGGLVELSMLPNNPWTGGDAWDVRREPLGNLVTPGGLAYREWRQQLNFYAEILLELQDANIPILFRPLMEMNGDWFWYGHQNQDEDEPPDEFVNLYRDLYYYFTDSVGLNNLIWIYSANRSFPGIPPVDFYYPGDDVVDIVGIDLYENGLEMEPEQYQQALALGKPFALTEIGPNHDDMDGTHDYHQFVTKILADYPETIYAHAWHSWPDHLVTWVDNRNFSAALNESCVVTRDELDGLTSYPALPLDPVRVFPNPVMQNGMMTIEGLDHGEAIRMYTITGQLTREFKWQNQAGLEIDTSPGVYWLEFDYNLTRRPLKIIVF